MIDPSIINAGINAAGKVLTKQPLTTISGANNSSLFNSSGWTVATDNSTATGGGFNMTDLLWFAGGFLSVLLITKLKK